MGDYICDHARLCRLSMHDAGCLATKPHEAGVLFATERLCTEPWECKRGGWFVQCVPVDSPSGQYNLKPLEGGE